MLLCLQSVIWFPIKLSTRWNISHKFSDSFFDGGKSYKLLKPNEVGRFEIVCPYFATRNIGVRNANSILIKLKGAAKIFCSLSEVPGNALEGTRHWIWICASLLDWFPHKSWAVFDQASVEDLSWFSHPPKLDLKATCLMLTVNLFQPAWLSLIESVCQGGGT